MIQIILQQFVQWLKHRPVFGIVSAFTGSMIAYREELNIALTLIGAGVGILVGILSAWAKYLEIKERKNNLRQNRGRKLR